VADAGIEDLARSIRANGIIQPIVVRKVEGGYEIIAGERRWRAAQRAALLKVPIVIRDVPDERLLAAALVENIQRESQPDGTGGGAPEAGRRASLYAGANRRGCREGSVLHHELPALVASAHEVRENVASGTLSMGHARVARTSRRNVAGTGARRCRASSRCAKRVLVKKAATPAATRQEPHKDAPRAAEERPASRSARARESCARGRRAD
jgi:ParB family chromosome partitioning protein